MSTTSSADGDSNTILHIGLGSFHRAHQAVYLHRLQASGDTSWSIVGGNIRDDMPETMAALAAQHGQYTLETVSPAGERRYERIRSIRVVIPFDPSLARLIEVGAEPSTRIISCTVTEAGYYLDSKHRLDPSHADLRSDLDGDTRGTIYGALAAILQERMQRGGSPVTLLNCDNVRGGGGQLRSGLLEFLDRRGQATLRAWVEANTSCPSTMVDRITPRPPPDLAERVKAATGWDDRAPVMSESFMQWVIEDDFIAGRPAWERAGAEMVTSVHAHEEAKIRILNATHSGVAWAGTLRGLRFIHEDMALPEIRQMAHDFITRDVIPSLHTPEHPSPIDLAHYRDTVLERFANPHVPDTNQRVAMDGFSKIPGFILPTLRARLAAGVEPASAAMLPALFFAVLDRWHRGALAYTYQDGVMDPAAAHALFAAPDPLGAFCRDPILWGPLAGDPVLEAAIRAAEARIGSFESLRHERPTMFLVCGEALMDVFAHEDTPSGVSLDARIGGSPMNVAIGLARLGQRVAFLGALSRGFLGERLHRALDGEGVDLSYAVSVDAPTTLGLVGLDARGSASYAFYGHGCADRLLRAEHLQPLGDDIRALHFGSYSMVVEPVASTHRLLVERECSSRVISYDPNPRLNVEPDLARWIETVRWMARRSHLLKVSSEDLELLHPGEPVAKVANEWLALGVCVVLVTEGSNGALGFTRSDSVRVEALNLPVVDTVGAGDTFQAAALTWLAEQGLLSVRSLAALTAPQLEALMNFASAAAAITCSRRGADMPRRTELQA